MILELCPPLLERHQIRDGNLHQRIERARTKGAERAGHEQGRGSTGESGHEVPQGHDGQRRHETRPPAKDVRYAAVDELDARACEQEARADPGRRRARLQACGDGGYGGVDDGLVVEGGEMDERLGRDHDEELVAREDVVLAVGEFFVVIVVIAHFAKEMTNLYIIRRQEKEKKGSEVVLPCTPAPITCIYEH